MKFWIRSTTQVFALTSLGISQPIFNVLANSPEFFTSYGFGGNELIVLSVLISIIFPLLILLPIAMISILNVRWAEFAFLFLAGMLVSLFSLLILSDLPTHDYIKIGLALVLGFVTLMIVRKSYLIQQWLSWLAIGVVVFPVLFLTNPNIAPLLADKIDDSINLTPLGADHPVVFVVFDQLPTSALIDENLQIDSVRYPHFSALAADSYWFRNSTSNAQDTITSLPTILTGKYPTGQITPIFSNYPENIFALMNDHYYMNVSEFVTQLNPVAPTEFRGSRQAIYISLFADIALVYLHVALPVGLTGRLPSIESKTFDFWEIEEKVSERGPQRMRGFIDRIDDGARRFHYAHFAIPHGPYRFRESGNRYTKTGSIPGLPKKWGNWGPDKAPIDMTLLRYLQQVQLADSMLGELILYLHELDIYDQTMIVVTSDHGMSFNASDHTRAVTKQNYLDILYVPLFIKLPDQSKGATSDINSELVDVFPTIFDLLGGSIPWDVDGVSLFNEKRIKNPKRALAHLDGQTKLHEFPSRNGGEFSKLEPLSRTLGWDSDKRSNFLVTPFRSMIGKKAESVSERFFRLKDPEQKGFLTDPDLSLEKALFELDNGWLRGPVVVPDNMKDHDLGTSPLYAAVISDGQIIAITPLFTHKSHKLYFAELLSEKHAPLNEARISVRILK